MEITPEFLIPIIIAGVAVIGLIWVIIKNRKSLNPEKTDAIITQLYSLAKIIYNAIKNDGKIDATELQSIFEQIKVIIAIITKKEIQQIDDEFRPIDYIEDDSN